MLWINGGSAYILGQWSKIETLDSYDLQWDEIEHEEEDHAECAECGDDMGVRDDCEDYAFDRYGDTVPCCEGCSFVCDVCDERFTNDCERRDEGDTVCRGCQGDRIAERERKARERAEEIERLEKKRTDLELIAKDLQSQMDDNRTTSTK